MLVVAAPAKLNLSLEVVGRRPDGYHDLDSVVAPLDWHDLVGVRLQQARTTTVRLRLTGPAAEGVPDSDDNLAVRAGRALAAVSDRSWAIDIWLDKRLPSAAGLGGGSADAAAVLRAGARLLSRRHAGISDAALVELAGTLGSDVPATLRPVWLRLMGRGERLLPLPPRELHVAVVVAGVSLTPMVFASLLPAEVRGDGRSQRLAEALHSGAELGPADLGSALELAALRVSEPLRSNLDRLRRASAGTPWQLTGSGGAAFTITRDRAEAQRLSLLASGLGLAARPCRTLNTGWY